MPDKGRVQRVIAEFRRRLVERDAEQMEQMAQQWLAVERRLQADFLALAQEVADLRSKGETISQAKLAQLDLYRSLLAQAQAETLNYQAWAADLIAGRQRELARLGIENAAAMIRESYLEAGAVVARFNLLPIEAIETMIGFAGDGSPLFNLLFESYPSSVMDLTQALVAAIARGENPRRTARAMANAMAGNLQRSLTVARTEQMRVYRTTSLEQMRASGVVEGWYWRSANQTNTCMACIAKDDGTIHPLDEELNDHPNGRCFRQPAIKGLPKLEVQSGIGWFESQPEETQRQMLGPARYEGWQAGLFQIGDLAKERSSAEWGAHVVEAGLKDLTP